MSKQMILPYGTKSALAQMWRFTSVGRAHLRLASTGDAKAQIDHALLCMKGVLFNWSLVSGLPTDAQSSLAAMVELVEAAQQQAQDDPVGAARLLRDAESRWEDAQDMLGVSK